MIQTTAVSVLIAFILVLAGSAAVPAFGILAWDVFKDQGSFIGGLLALAAGILAYRAGLKQAEATLAQNRQIQDAADGDREARLTRCRALLSLPMTELQDYALDCIDVLLSLSGDDPDPTEIILDATVRLLPPVPQRAIELIGETIGNAPRAQASRLARFLQLVQVQNSRVREVVETVAGKRPNHLVVISNIDGFIVDSLDILAWTNLCLRYARFAIDDLPEPTRAESWEISRFIRQYGDSRYQSFLARRLPDD